MLRILKYGHPILETPCLHVRLLPSVRIDKLIERMFETMYAANGVGLAAPQIGIKKRIAVIDTSSGKDESKRLVLINPVIEFRRGSIPVFEGCLSIPGFWASVSRAEQIEVNYFSPDGSINKKRFHGYMAHAVQHEVGHLQGQLYLDLLSPLKRDLIKRKIQKLRRKALNDGYTEQDW